MLTTALHLHDLMNPGALLDAIEDGYVRQQTHPKLPLAILNYTTQTQAERVWNEVTKQCRGLIIDTRTGDVVARPLAKFFTFDQIDHGLPIDAPAYVFDKLDGSLGILYPTGDGQHAVATRGSFTSPQARHATKVWRERFADKVMIDPTFTYLFEIIYPSNRIVLDYGDLDDLVFLGAVNNETGLLMLPGLIDWPGRVAEQFTYLTLGEALAAPPRPNAEGFVIHLPVQKLIIKLKQADYLALHAVLTNTSARTIWEYLAVNAVAHLIDHPKKWASLLRLDPRRAERRQAVGPDWLARMLDNVPDEFHAWVKRTAADLTSSVAALAREVDEYADLARYVYGDDRKAMAAEVADHHEQGLVFKRVSGDDITAQLWLRFYPEADIPWLVQEEEAA
ncbi:RNA ligase [Nonomuraea sp. NPDC050202]|uniref:RNA ligase n=1 Tax=Nonomuraea sp. NPDC050202 TaxID=3155035 RepID=UPI0033DF1862